MVSWGFETISQRFLGSRALLTGAGVAGFAVSFTL
jgi:hypothetical protein